MLLSLRKARKLETKISNFDICVPNSYIKILDAVDKKKVGVRIKATQNEFSKGTKDMLSLADIRHSIRDLISKANSTSGVNSLMGKKACLATKISVLRNAVSKASDNTAADIVNKAAKIDKLASDRFTPERIDIPLLSEKEADKYREQIFEMNNQIEDISEDILILNNQTKVDIDEESIKILRRFKLVS